ncbi:glycosyl hydrolase family 61-domain-containing protein [Pseudomassariella vexata]|uniref:lytic cellulose monooxygenase (C4-dehydrogenating) n=1 Tax=Pseudomassariella vexata TaxID=1141098 RepID=A0A1Y2EEL2_9PEZI|nr:glycosyl hydrolase family 61-domain-containing protein [Pseudomassariella vexata]ORY70018.1 glycosyl hydrolase family 61-domain-containing protein [Pseudomassariella vexata]
MHYTAAAALVLASSVAAHTRVYSAWVNGVDQGDGRDSTGYIRSPPTNDPVKDLTSTDLVCNVNGGTPVSSFVSAAAGDKVAFEWYHDSRNDDIIASSHKGPIITYIAPYTEDNGASAIWSKIDEEGYDSTTGSWAVDNLIANAGQKEFTIPSTLAAGKYLIRQEIIGLHEADASYAENSARGAQFYPSCLQFDITGSGSAAPDENFNFNTGYTEADPGVVFNLYGSFTSYEIPGPAVWDAAGSSGGAASTIAVTSTAASTSTAAVETTAAPTTIAAPTTLATSVKASSTAVASSPAEVVSTTAAAATPTKGCSKRRNANRKF